MGWGTGRCRSTVASLGCWDTHVTPPAAGCPALYRYLADIWRRTSFSELDGRTGTFLLPDQEDPTDHRPSLVPVFSGARGFSGQKTRTVRSRATGTCDAALRDGHGLANPLAGGLYGLRVSAGRDSRRGSSDLRSAKPRPGRGALPELAHGGAARLAHHPALSLRGHRGRLDQRLRPADSARAENPEAPAPPRGALRLGDIAALHRPAGRPAPFLSVRGTVTDTNQRRLFRECHRVLEAGAPEGQGGVRQGSPGLTDAAGRALAGARAGAQAPRGDRGHLRLRADRAR